MNQQNRSIRIGAAAIACACTFRLGASELPGRFLSWLKEPDTAAFVAYLETGRDVRFSASTDTLWVFPGESPPPQAAALPQTQPELPVFAGEEAAAIYNTSAKKPDTAQLLTSALDWNLTGDAPTVLILHTHATESYAETSGYRSQEETENMLAIGAYVAQLLAEQGITAIQDRELHDYPSYNGSYVDARGAIQEYLEKYPTIELVLDLHRDAAGTGQSQLRTLAEAEGERTAQLMLVMGTNYDTWQENLALGLKLHAQLERQAPGIMRKLCLRPQRFNQDLCPGALLVEVGAAGNTQEEALRAARQLAKAVIALSQGTGDE